MMILKSFLRCCYEEIETRTFLVESSLVAWVCVQTTRRSRWRFQIIISPTESFLYTKNDEESSYESEELMRIEKIFPFPRTTIIRYHHFSKSFENRTRFFNLHRRQEVYIKRNLEIWKITTVSRWKKRKWEMENCDSKQQKTINRGKTFLAFFRVNKFFFYFANLHYHLNN